MMEIGSDQAGPFSYAVVLSGDELIYGALIVLALAGIWAVFVIVRLVMGARRVKSQDVSPEVEEFLQTPKGQELLNSPQTQQLIRSEPSRPSEKVHAKRPENGNLIEAVHSAATANHAFPDKTPADDCETVAVGAAWIEILFEAEGIEWTLAHWGRDEFGLMERAATLLELYDVAELVAEADSEAENANNPKWETAASDDPDLLAMHTRFRDLEGEFAASGGADRVAAVATDYLDRHYAWA